MARKRKNRTHLKGVNRDAVNEVDTSAPKSFVIKSGIVGHSVTQLVRDIRKIMEPHTASRLRERASARLRDYLAMAPALKVSHLMALTLSPTTSTVHMRVARLPAGPTLTFRVERYSLMKDLTMAKSKYVGHPPSLEAFRTPPLLVLSNFNPAPGEAPKPQLKLMSTMFQGMFPPIQIDKSALPSFRRVLLISHHTDTATISMRHYIITIRATGVSRRVRRVLDASTASANGRKLDLTNDQDISDYLLGLRSNGYDTASESEGDSEAEGSDTGPGQSSRKIELPADYGRSKKGETKAVRLVEIGPRIEMKLGKVVEGVVGGARGEGETVWHERIHKSASEKTQLKSTHATKAAEKAARRAEQEANVARKKDEAAAKEALKTSKRGKRPETSAAEANEEEESDGDEVVHDYEGEDEFEFEDRVAAVKKGKQPAAAPASDDDSDDDDDDDEAEDGMDDWDGDEEAGEVSSEDEEVGADGPDLDEGNSSDEEGAPVAPRPARPRPTKKVRK